MFLKNILYELPFNNIPYRIREALIELVCLYGLPPEFFCFPFL